MPTIAPETVPVQEKSADLEKQPASPALKHRIALGAFDVTKSVDTTPPRDVSRKTFDALHNRNMAKRQQDADDFARKIANPDHPLSPEDVRDAQMSFWTANVYKHTQQLIGLEQQDVLTSLVALGIPVAEKNGQNFRNHFYDPDTKAEGEFYKKFCTGNMNEHLANALTAKQMLSLKPFLTKWMLGSDEAFNALIVLRQTMDDLKSDEARVRMTQFANADLSDRDKGILAYFQGGVESETVNVPQETEKNEEKSPPLVGFAESQGRRSEMEDAHVIETSLNGNKDWEFYAIYDGHGGKRVSEGAATVLHRYLIHGLNDGLSPSDAMKYAYRKTQEQLTSEKMPGGSTAITVFKDGEKIVVGGLGDARAVMVKNNGQAERLSHDRKANDPEEQKAVQERGGTITQDGRVAGGKYSYAISAALGDLDVPGLQREPDIKELQQLPNDKWLILACDGIWDVIQDSEVAGIIGTETNPQKASQLLVDEAYKRGSGDNLSAIALSLENAAQITDQQSQQQEKQLGSMYTESLLAGLENRLPAPALDILANQLDKSATHFREQGIIDNAQLALALAENFTAKGMYQRIVEQQMFGPQDFERAENENIVSKQAEKNQPHLLQLTQEAEQNGIKVNATDQPGWFHYFSPHARGETKYRVYLNPDTGYMPQVIENLLQYAQTHPLYFKTIDPRDHEVFARSDKIVLYLNKDNADAVVRFVQDQLIPQNQDAFQNRFTAGSSTITIAPGAGLATQPEQKPNEPEMTAGLENAKRIEQALLTSSVVELKRIINTYPTETAFLQSPEYEIMKKVIHPDYTILPPTINHSQQTKDLFAESLLRAIYKNHTNLELSLNQSNLPILKLPIGDVVDAFKALLKTNNLESLVNVIDSLSQKDLEYQYGNPSSLSTSQLIRTNLAVTLASLLTQNQNPGNVFRQLSTI